MASSSVPTVPTKVPRKNLRRIMLTKVEEPMAEIDQKTQDAIVNSICEFVRTFKSRKEFDNAIVLGFNTICRQAEQCDDTLKIVFLNAHLKPDIMLTALYKLCVYKCIPVGRLENFKAISEAMSPQVKGLKPTFAAFGVLESSPNEFRSGLVEKLPPVIMAEEPPMIEPKRARTAPPPYPEVDVEQFYIKCSESATASQRRSSHISQEEFLSLAEKHIPMVDYGSFIGSDRSLVTPQPELEDDKPRKKLSKYKQPVMQIR